MKKLVTNKDLKKRIIEISYIHKLSHLSSCITAVDIISYIYERKSPEDIFVLSSGHAGLALYVVLEKYERKNAEALYVTHGVHPSRSVADGIYASSGSLGHGIGIAVGMALANRNRNVYVLLSDGECSEGSVNESLRVAYDLNLTNISIHLNDNGYGAYRKTQPHHLVDVNLVKNLNIKRWETEVNEFPFLQGVGGHYHTMSEKDYELAMEILM